MSAKHVREMTVQCPLAPRALHRLKPGLQPLESRLQAAIDLNLLALRPDPSARLGTEYRPAMRSRRASRSPIRDHVVPRPLTASSQTGGAKLAPSRGGQQPLSAKTKATKSMVQQKRFMARAPIQGVLIGSSRQFFRTRSEVAGSAKHHRGSKRFLRLRFAIPFDSAILNRDRYIVATFETIRRRRQIFLPADCALAMYSREHGFRGAGCFSDGPTRQRRHC